MTKKIILASASLRRKELLKSLGFKFRVVPSSIDEKLNPRLKPRSQAEELSRQKALHVARKCEDAIIIAADTLVVVDGEILGKPIDFREAKRFLRKLSGKKHSVLTGFTIVDTTSKKSITASVETEVLIRKILPREIDQYVILEEVTDAAGGYAIQGKAKIFIEKIHGDYFNVIGLPLFALARELRKFGVSVI